MVNLLSVKKLKCGSVFNNISFNIAEKTFNILIGKNGVGKTALVYSILGLIKYEGEIIFKYERKDIGCISDFSEIIEDNIFEYLSKPLKNLGYSDDKAKKTTYSVTKKLGINNLLDKSKNELDSEQRLLVLLAHTIIHNPKLVIIDNTLDELHESSKLKFINYLLSMNAAVILITNDSRYFKYAKKLLIMTKSSIEIVKDKISITKLENLLNKNNSELTFSLELSHKLYEYGIIDTLYNDNSELVGHIWK